MIEEFNQQGFPVVKLFDDHFEIKAIDISTFRSFNFSEILRIEYYKESDKGDWFFWPWVQVIKSWTDTYKLKVIKQNGGDWEYKTRSKTSDSEFEKLIERIKTQCVLNENKTVTNKK
jgi:hypothetical protein